MKYLPVLVAVLVFCALVSSAPPQVQTPPCSHGASNHPLPPLPPCPHPYNQTCVLNAQATRAALLATEEARHCAAVRQSLADYFTCLDGGGSEVQCATEKSVRDVAEDADHADQVSSIEDGYAQTIAGCCPQ